MQILRLQLLVLLQILNGKALLQACNLIKDRLKKIAANHLDEKEEDLFFENNEIKGKQKSIVWEDLIELALKERAQLSEKGHYITPEINFDREKEKGHPFSYHVYGTAISVVTVDCLRGIYEIDKVHICS